MNNNWKLTHVGQALVVSSGQVFLADKKPGGLRLEEVLELTKQHPNTGYYSKPAKRIVTLSEAIGNNIFKDLGKEIKVERSIDLYLHEHDREFESLPKTGKQLLENKYKSRPLEVKE